MRNTDFIVLEQNSAGFASNSVHGCESHDVALGHNGSTHVRIELAIIVNEGIKLFFLAGFKGLLVLGKDTHVPWATPNVHNFFSVEK